MITDVSRLRLHLCTIITSTAPTQIVGENAEPRVRRLTGDISVHIDRAIVQAGTAEDLLRLGQRNDLRMPGDVAVPRHPVERFAHELTISRNYCRVRIFAQLR